ncbi:MAG: hypothetical protein WA966_01640 [Ornithinimicrobium sp.]
MSLPLSEPGPLDATDVQILAELREVYARIDPVPASLPERLKYAMTVQMLEAEVAELTAMPMATVRSSSAEQIDTISFSGSSMSLMVSLVTDSAGVRVDGWASQGGAVVEIRFTDDGEPQERVVVCDEHGRCVFEDLPPGPAHFIIWSDESKASTPIITPTITL